MRLLRRPQDTWPLGSGFGEAPLSPWLLGVFERGAVDGLTLPVAVSVILAAPLTSCVPLTSLNLLSWDAWDLPCGRAGVRRRAPMRARPPHPYCQAQGERAANAPQTWPGRPPTSSTRVRCGVGSESVWVFGRRRTNRARLQGPKVRGRRGTPAES